MASCPAGSTPGRTNLPWAPNPPTPLSGLPASPGDSSYGISWGLALLSANTGSMLLIIILLRA